MVDSVSLRIVGRNQGEIMDKEKPKSKKSSKVTEPAEKNIFIKTEIKDKESKDKESKDKVTRNLNEEMLSSLKTLVTIGVGIITILTVGILSLWFNMANNQHDERDDRMMRNMMVELYLQNEIDDPSMNCGMYLEGWEYQGSCYNDDGIYRDGGLISQDDGIYGDGNFSTNDNNQIEIDPGQPFRCRPMDNFERGMICGVNQEGRENLGSNLGSVDGATVTSKINR